VTEKDALSLAADDLRRRAEEVARARSVRKPEVLDGLSPEEANRILHELRVHQVELEMQNEELRRAQEELEASRARYFDLYDLAPVGYLTLSDKGLIREANLTFAALLGVTRSELVKQPLTRFIVREDQDIYYRHLRQLLKTGAPQRCEIRMLRKETAPFWARLEAASAQDDGVVPLCRVAVSDISGRIRAEQAEKRATEELQKAHDALESRVEERTAEVRALSWRLLSVQEEERKRIAMDLHDGLGGLLSAVKYKFEAAQGEQEVSAVIPYLQQAIDDCRRIQTNLRPLLLDDLGLLAALSWLVRDFQKRKPGVKVRKQLRIEEEAIPQHLKMVIFRITQEALTNISKHSGADRVSLSLRNSGGTLRLVVRDHGQGFAAEKALAERGLDRGIGLDIMRERAEWAGGIFSIETLPGKGTVVQASWPGGLKDAGLLSGKKVQGPGKKK
jgi:PAS domain S-box-containing protein